VLPIIDADTIWVRCNGQRAKIRLAQIDAPEVAHPRYGKPGQPYGEEAKQALEGLIDHHAVRVQWSARGYYHRIIGEVYLGRLDVNAWLVGHGDAWAYPRYVHDPRLFKLQRQAQREGIGLWSQPNPVPPWQWRHGHHTSGQTQSSSSFTCGGTRYCSQMTSCAEAKSYLHHCGLSRLDGDHDGVPCERLCRWGVRDLKRAVVIARGDSVHIKRMGFGACPWRPLCPKAWARTYILC